MYLSDHDPSQDTDQTLAGILQHAKYTRIAARIIFIVLSLYLTVIGKACYNLSLKLRLLKHDKIPAVDAAGWLSGESLLTPLFRMRTLPNVPWWLLMVFFMILSKVTDIATATIQQQAHAGQRCNFEAGMVLSPDGKNNSFSKVPANTQGQLMAYNAQWTSAYNGCPIGIYEKLNGNSSFCADELDIWGNWSCSYTATPRYKHGSPVEGVLDDLTDQNMLYRGPQSKNVITADNNDYDWTQLVVWNSLPVVDGQGRFDVKACVDESTGVKDDKQMYCMYCTMNATKANGIAGGFDQDETLFNWVDVLQDAMYYGSYAHRSENSEFSLVRVLNSLIMVAGSSDTLTSTPIENPEQGCIIYPTFIPNWLLYFAGAIVLLCLIMTLLYITNRLRLHFHENHKSVEYTPSGSWGWIGQAIAEAEGLDFVHRRDLRGWYIARNGEKGVRVVKQSGGFAGTGGGGGVEMKDLAEQHEREPMIRA